MKNYAEVSDMIEDLRDTAETQWSDLGYPDHHLVFKIRDLFAVATGGREAFPDEHKRMISSEFDQYTRGRCGWQTASYPRREYCDVKVHTYEDSGSFEERSFCPEHVQEIRDGY